MRKKLFFSLLVFAGTLFTGSMYAQTTPEVLWAEKFGGTTADVGSAVATDADGNVYTTGRFTGTVTFGSTTLTPTGIFVAKTDAAGTVVWAKRYVGPYTYDVTDIAVDISGNVYITGTFFETGTFGSTTLNPMGGVDTVFVVKLDSTGEVVWVNQFQGSHENLGYGIAVDTTGNVYVTGQFMNTGYFGSITLIATGAGSGGIDAFVAKLDSTGTVVWAQKFGGTGTDIGNAVATDAMGNVYVTGQFAGTATFGSTTLTSAGFTDVFVVKLNATGEVVWAERFGGVSGDQGRNIATDTADNVYVTGLFNGTATFGGTTLTSTGSTDIFVVKLNTTGTVVWAEKFGGTGGDIGHSITTDITGNVYITGSFSGTEAAFGSTTLASAGGTDVFVVKTDASGTALWAERFGGTTSDIGHGITTDNTGSVYVTGRFAGTATSGTITLTSAGNTDIFLLKIGVANIGITGITVTVAEGGVSTVCANEETIQLVAAIAPEDATNPAVTWSVTSGSEYASVNESGLITILAAGTAIIRAAWADNTDIFGEITITVNPIPEVVLETTSDEICEGETSTLIASSEGHTIYWYDSADAAEHIASGSAFTTPALSETTSYWVEAISEEGCISARTEIIVTVNPTPELTIVTPSAAICEGSDAVLTATTTPGNLVVWYDSPDATEGTEGNSYTPLNLTETTSYWVQAHNPETDCASERIEITVTVLPSPVLNVETTEYTICVGTAAELYAASEGNVIFWYANEEDVEYTFHGNIFVIEGLTESTTYWVEAYNIATGCASERIEVTVTVNPVPDAPIAVEVQYFEEGETLADLDVEATGTLTWYADEFLTVELPETTPLEAYTTYYVTQTIGGCESEAVGIFVEPELGITGVNGKALTVYPNPTDGIVKIQAETAVSNIEVFGVNGQLVTSVKAMNEVNLSGYPGGTYVVRVTLENGEIVTKKVIKR